MTLERYEKRDDNADINNEGHRLRHDDDHYSRIMSHIMSRRIAIQFRTTSTTTTKNIPGHAKILVAEAAQPTYAFAR